MKISELASRAGVTTETIRKYRERGLLQPHCQSDNGYYEYSEADFLNLLFIRKQRGANLSLDTIKGSYLEQDAESLLEGYRSTIQNLEEQIRTLLRRKRMLLVTYRHYERDVTLEGVERIEAFGDKYDSYFWPEQDDPAHAFWVRNIDLFTLVACVEKRYFEAETLPERIPVRLGIGTYGTILRENDLPVPRDCRVFPKGEYAAFFLELEDLDSFPAEALRPVREFLKSERLLPDSDTTGYLYRVDTAGGTRKFIFCTRVKVTPMD